MASSKCAPVCGPNAGKALSSTNTMATNTSIGLPSDAAWSGSGPGTVISILKEISGPSEQHLGEVGGRSFIATASFIPAASAAYVDTDVIADSATVATVNANVSTGAGIMRLHVARIADKTGMIRRVRLKTTDTAFAGKIVRVHLFKNRPVLTNGDSALFLSTESDYIGYSDVTLDRHFSDAEKGIGVPAVGSEFNFESFAGTDYIHAVLESKSAVTATAAKTMTLSLEVLQN